jgi:N-acetylglutamate synthase-like GNAT family acetyltransferase
MLIDTYQPEDVFARVPELAAQTDPVLKELDTLLDDDDLYQQVRADFGKRYRFTLVHGRHSTPVEVLLRMLLCKHLSAWSFQETEVRVKDSLVLRWFCRVYFERVPDETTLLRWLRTLHPETLHALNDRVVQLAVQARVTKGRKLRLDATCVQTEIHHPTDSGLLVESVRVLSRLVKGAKALVKEQVSYLEQTTRSRLRSARKTAQALHRHLRRKSEVLASINKTGKARKKVKLTHIVKSAEFSKATIQDMPEVGELLRTFFSKINIEKRRAWIEKNPEICTILRSDDKIIGCAFIVPLLEEKIMQILNAQIKPPTRPSDILLYEPGKHYCLYIRSVVVLQSVPKIQKRYWAAKLIGELIREIEKMGKKGILIDKIYAQTDIRHIEHLLKMLGFTQIISPTAANNFVLDIAISGSLYAIKFRKSINTWLEE